MFTKVSFQNLRCFKDFTLENLTPVTLISGRNNVGKTTVLEGLYLLLAYSDVSVFYIINGWRGGDPSVSSSPLWDILFPDMNSVAQRMQISAKDENDATRTVDFFNDSRLSLIAPVDVGAPVKFSHPLVEKQSLTFTYVWKSETECTDTGSFTWDSSGGVMFNAAPGVTIPRLFGHYVGPSVTAMPQIVGEWLGKIEIADKKEQLIKSLRFLYDEIIDVFVVPSRGGVDVFSRLGNGKVPLPIRAMGGGMNKLLYYLTLMIANPGGIFLLDEIETGFHHSFYSKMWKLIARVAKETGSQIFATTHSYECIGAAHDGVLEVDPALLTYVRLGKEGESIVPHYFSGDDLAFVLERDMEVR